jgi:tetratricopeptide (TPR) repeat protein
VSAETDSSDAVSRPARIADRYRVCAVLGRGGMGNVYRVIDETSGRELALKQLQVPVRAPNRPVRHVEEALFEQEYRTLAQLHHPRVISVFEYGLAAEGPYYSMELLQGDNLSECAPVPWRQACVLMHDVCSALALLHARRLIHRDVSPHNVLRAADGRAKLIDFGAMAPIGSHEQPVGTPAFSAPEVVQRASIDARTDLYSLGATLYYALTGRLPYAASSFGQLSELWATRPVSPALLVSSVPARLDALVMGLLSLEPALRPRTASEVMQQLAGLAELESDEHLDLSRVFLTTPTLVGRTELVAAVKQRALRVARDYSRPGSGMLVLGDAGMGRTRALDACVTEAKTLGLLVLRAQVADADARSFAVMQSLTAQLCEQLPQRCLLAAQSCGVAALLFEPAAASEPPRLQDFGALGSGRAPLQDGLCSFWLQVTREQPLAIAVDDIERIDEASGACLARLADRVKHHRLLLFFSAAAPTEPELPLLAVLARACGRVPLARLTAPEVEQLFQSVFGDVPHVALLADRIARVAQGNPRACMDLAQHLVDEGRVRYEAGSWVLPSRLEATDLPSNPDQTFALRVAALSAPSRRLAEIHALSAYPGLSLHDHSLLAEASDPAALAQARSELLALGVLRGNRQVFRVANDAWRAALIAPMSPADRLERHRALAALGGAAQKHPLPTAQHFLCAELPERAIDRLMRVIDQELQRPELFADARMTPDAAAELCERALLAAQKLGRPERELSELRRWLVTLSPVTDYGYYARSAPVWLGTLERDSGLQDWAALAELRDPEQRLREALQRAAARHATAPAHARAYSVSEAIKYLVHYLVVSIVIATRSYDAPLTARLAELLLPFAGLSPLLDAMIDNARATKQAILEAQFSQAHERFCRVFAQLSELQGEAARSVAFIRHGVAFGIGTLEAARGMASASRWADQLEREANHATDALQLRKVICLQHGDLEGAERQRRAAELQALQSGVRPLFLSSLIVEISAHAMAGDLSGVRNIADQIDALAERFPGWLPFQAVARGLLESLRGDLRAAKRALERALELCAPTAHDRERSINGWPMAAGAYLHVLVGLGEYSAAQQFGLETLRACERLGIFTADDVTRGLALAEAKLGEHASASERLSRLIAQQLGLGVSGLHLGASYEARARVAIEMSDRAAFQEYGALSAREYGHGRGSSLGARYERLLGDARRAGVDVPNALSEFESRVLGASGELDLAELSAELGRAGSTEARASSALRSICRAAAADGGELYLVLPDGGLLWAASQPEHPPEPNRHKQAREALDRALGESGPTQVSSGTGSGEAEQSASGPVSTDNGAGAERVLLLTSGAHHVAVVLLQGGRAGEMLRGGLLAQIGACLREAGDTSGLRTG